MHFWDIHTHREGQPHSIYQAECSGTRLNTTCSVGIHPWNVGWDWEEALIRIQACSKKSEQVIAIGEAGFDRLRGPELTLQKRAFNAQARWAAELGVPLILHCVRSHDLLLEYLKSAKNPPSILWHGWNQKSDLAIQLLPFSIFFSFGKDILHPSSNAAKWLLACPLDRIFFETDDSGVGISSIYQAASLILGLPVEQIIEQVLVNWNAISKRKIS